MKLNVLGLVLAASAFTSLAANAQTTVIEHRDDPAVVVEHDHPAASVTVKEAVPSTEKTTKKIETTGDGCTTKTVRHEDVVGSKTVKKTDCD
ncbi:MAG TPA: hypothetical protein VFP74_14295 [Pseudolabrys sp.]|jgi:hypothetical protein|nr:hypothetical protein [Pseudolabrys sp.]